MPNRIELQNPVTHEAAPDREMQAFTRTVQGKKVTGLRYSYRGMGRVIRERKRIDAELRNEETIPENRRQVWRVRGWNRKSEAVMCGQA